MIDMMIWTDDYGATATGYWSSHKRGLKQAVEITKFGSRWSIKMSWVYRKLVTVTWLLVI